MRAQVLMAVTGVPVHPLQAVEDDPVIEACLRELGTEIDLDEFIDGDARPSQLLILFRSHRPEGSPILVASTPKLSEYIKGRSRVQ